MNRSRITKKVAAAALAASSIGFVGNAPAEAASGWLGCPVRTRTYTLGTPVLHYHTLNGVTFVFGPGYWYTLDWPNGGSWSATPNGAATCH
ncbi:MAG: hypothetical protein R2694_17995 [Ilumatobacteraceae bacterium]|nr:hypothetical protein [Ilumatobacter sp.]MCB0983778.1 hypothetical protein [Ilumatobacter sp.]MCB9382825.1 hypothetical protein [Acidimicrobiaceae bacterium]